MVTSDDVAYGLERGFLPSVDSRIATIYFRSIRGAEAFRDGRADTISGLRTPDDDTLLIELKRPVARSVAQALTLTLAAPVPREYAAQYDHRPTSTYGRHLVATGPYRFDSDAGGQLPGPDARSLDLVRNPAWDPETDFRPAFLDSISVVPATDEDRAGEEVLNGHDSVSGDFAASRHLLETAKPKLGDQIRLAQSSATAYVTLNTRRPPSMTCSYAGRSPRPSTRRVLVPPSVGRWWVGFRPTGFHLACRASRRPGGMRGRDSTSFPIPTATWRSRATTCARPAIPRVCYDGNASLEAVGVDQPYTRDLAGSVQRAFASLGIELEVRSMGAKRTDQLCTTRATTPAVCLNGYWLNDFDDAESVLPPLFSGAVIRDRANTNLSLLDDPSANLAMEDANETTGAADRAEASSRTRPRPSPPAAPRRPLPGRGPGRIVHSVRPSSSLNENGRTPSSMRRSNDSDAPMRWPLRVVERAAARAGAATSRAARRAGTSAVVSGPGSELPSSSAQAPRRSLATCSLRLRSSSRWRSTIQPETRANSSSTTTTVA